MIQAKNDMNWLKKLRARTTAGYVTNIESKSIENTFFREVLYTSKLSQLVVMSLKPEEDIGMEVHENVDQFIRVEEGTGKVILDGKEHELKAGSVVVIPFGTEHNIINTSTTEDLKLYTVYTPPQHPDGTIHKTKAEAMEEE